MKNLLFILLTFCLSYSYADSCHVDARTYVNTYVTQNGVRAITGTILNTALNKIINAVYCVDTSASGGVSQSALDDSVTALRVLRKMDSIDISLSASRDSTVFKFYINGAMYRVPIRDSVGVNTDAQTLTAGVNTLTISGGNTVDLNRKVDTSYSFRNASLDSICQIVIINGNSTRSCIKDSTGGGASLSGLTAATATNDIDNLNFKQRWNWNTLAGDTAFLLTSNSTQASSNLQTLFALSKSGANANANQTSYVQKISHTGSGSNNVNIGLKINVSGGTGVNSAGLIINASGGTSPRSIIIESGGGGIALNSEILFLSSNKYISADAQKLAYDAADRAHIFSTSYPAPVIIGTSINGAKPFSINHASANNYELVFGGDIAGGYRSDETSNNTIKATGGTLSFSAQTGLSGGFAAFTPQYRFLIKPSGAINFTPITATAASAITPAEGDVVMVSSTDGTFTSVGLWNYQGGAWVKL